MTRENQLFGFVCNASVVLKHFRYGKTDTLLLIIYPSTTTLLVRTSYLHVKIF